MKISLTPTIAALTASVLLGACASPIYPAPYGGGQTYPVTGTTYPPANPYPYQVLYGVVDSIQLVQGSNTQGSGVGAIVGGVVGGLLGNQVGKGSGRTVTTVAGAVGGALAGNEIEKNNGSWQRNQYQVGIRLDDGRYQTVVQDDVSGLQVGSRVRINNNIAYRY